MFGYMDSTSVKPAMRVDLFSHHLTISDFDDRVKNILLNYCRGLGQYGLKFVGRRTFRRAIVAVFAATTHDRREFRFHITQKEDVLRFLSSNGYPSETIEVNEIGLYEPVSVKLTDKSGKTPRENQIDPIEYLVSPGKIKVLTLQTGFGKTLITLKALIRIGQRTVIVIKGMYVPQWLKVLKKEFGFRVKDIMVVRGSDHLKGLINLAQHDGLKAKFIIVTSKTMANYYKSYELAKVGSFEYDCLPENFYRLLGAGVRVIDEVHQEFHANFRQDLYSHVPKTISLSATLDSDDSFINRMYRIMFPPEDRPQAIAHDKYIKVMALQYRITDMKRVRWMGVNQMYSHVKFEQSILKHKDIMERYFRMIYEIARDQFLMVFEPGQRMLIFCATVDMCTALTQYLKSKLPDIAIGRYTQEDDYRVLTLNDISVTTLKSAGTAVDIPGLRVAFMTDNIDSKQANIQALGRLRRLKQWPDVSPLFIYLYASSIPKHVIYHKRKIEKLRDRVLNYQDLVTSFHI